MDGRPDGAGNGKFDRLPGSAQNTTRRRLLAAAAGGFALAASGLVLPAWLAEEVEAAEIHPARRIPQRKERQRQERRHQLAHRRKVNRRQRNKDANDNTPRGGGIFDPLNISVSVRFSNAVPMRQKVVVSFQTYNDPGFGKAKTWDTQKTALLKLEETISYQFDVPKIRVVVDVPDVARWVEIENPRLGYPEVTVYDRDHHNERTYGLAENEEQLVKGRQNDDILKVRRNGDTQGYKNFVIDVLALGHFCSTC